MEEINLKNIEFKAKYICPFIPDLDRNLNKLDIRVSKKYQVISDLKNKRKS